MKKPKISVIAITRNRGELLKKCLKSLCNKPALKINYEVVVVDNGSTDKTRNIVNEIKKKSSFVKYVYESVPGVSTAKNTGIKHSKGEYIAFIDDDSISDKHWIEEISNFIKNNSEVKIFGGPYGRYSNINIPSWVPENFGKLDLGRKEKKLLIGKEWLSATNLVIHRSVFEKIGYFDEKINMNDKVRVYGEETEFLLRADARNYDVYYNPKQKVKHLIDSKKIDITWLIKDSFKRGKSIKKLTSQYPKKFYAGKTIRKKQTEVNNIFQIIVKYILSMSYIVGKIT